MKPSELVLFDPAPQRALITSRAETREAVLLAIRAGQRLLRCLHSTLAPFELSSVAATAQLERLLLADRSASVRLLVDNTSWLDTRAARLRLLQRRFPHALQMRMASSDDPVGEDAAIFADAGVSLRLEATPLVRGDLWLNNAPHAQPLIAAFDRRWSAAAHNLPVVPLGLG
jgi:hypothetical protein